MMKSKNMILCQFLCDACCVPCHWQYDCDKIQESILKENNPLIFPTNDKHWINPFYKIPVGKNSLYADQGRGLLISLSKNKSFNPLDYAKTLQDIYAGTNSLYGKFPEDDVSRSDYPVLRGWRSHSIKMFLSNIQAKQKELTNDCNEEKIYLLSGFEDEQSDCLAKITPFVALDYKNNPNSSLSKEAIMNIEKCVSITQTGQKAILTAIIASRILYYCLQDTQINESNHTKIFENILVKVTNELLLSNDIKDYSHPLDKDAAQAIQKALCNKDRSHIEFIAENGKGCGLFFNFVNALHCILSFNSLQEALKQTIQAGGDCVARSNFIGAVFGSLYPLENIIEDNWKDKYEYYNELSNQIDIILK